jgi:hypothetical protein
MSKSRCLFYKGQYYDVGTKVKIKTRHKGEIITTFQGFRRYDGLSEHDYYSGMSSEYYIVEIIEPVYYKEQEPALQKRKIFSLPPGDGPFYALLWYIAVMLGGIIFNDRWLIWIVATLIFFSYIKKK